MDIEKTEIRYSHPTSGKQVIFHVTGRLVRLETLPQGEKGNLVFDTPEQAARYPHSYARLGGFVIDEPPTEKIS